LQLPRNHFDRRIDALSVAKGRITKTLHGIGARPTVGPEAEADRAVTLEAAVRVRADAALARTAAALVDVHAVAPVAGELVAGITDAP
jgi:hypothetical protein